MLDIGAWLGPYTILLSKLVGPRGFVYPFEPDPGAFSHLRDNITVNRLSNVLAEMSALANHGGSLTLAATRLGGSLTSAIRFDSAAREQFVAHATTIDAYCGRNRIHPRGLKIDVEGWEGAVIKGGLDVLERCHPWLLLEFHGFLMSDAVRADNWRVIADRAKRIVPLEDSPPAPDYGHFFVEF